MKMVVLAGGKGSRLWPLSRESHPKQFLCFEEELSLLQKTLQRLALFCPRKDIVVVTCEEYELLVRRHCGEEGISILVEPENKGTGPSFALALLFLEQEKGLQPGELVALIPADNFISPEKELLDAFYLGKWAAEEGNLVLFGVAPTRAETGYGYIKRGEERQGLFTVQQFIEKPSKEVAESLCLDRRMLWNTGHVFMTSKIFWEEIQEHYGEIAALEALPLALAKEAFSSLSPISFDHALLEKSRRVLVCPIDISWSDLGSWDSLYEFFKKDAEGNVAQGNVVQIGSKDSLFWGNKKLIAAVGVEDLIVVDTDDALFLGKRGESQRVKDLVLYLKATRQMKLLSSHIVARPWGSYTVLDEGVGYKVKKITVFPGCRLSLQMHQHRSEHWMVVKGEAFVELEDMRLVLHEQETVFIPMLAKHRLSNQTEELLEIIEVQSGGILTEEDITRFEDDYARELHLCSC